MHWQPMHNVLLHYFWQISTNVFQVHVIQMPHAQMFPGRMNVNVCWDLVVMDQRALVCIFDLSVLTRFRQR